MQPREQAFRTILSQWSDSMPKLKNAREEEDLRDYGLDSLLFIQLVVVVEQRFSIEVQPEYLDIDKLNCIRKWTEYIAIASKETSC